MSSESAEGLGQENYGDRSRKGLTRAWQRCWAQQGSRVSVNKNQQCMLAVHCRCAGKGVLLLGRMFAQAAHMENGEGETGREDQCQK